MFGRAIAIRRICTSSINARGFKPMRGTGDKGSSSLFNNERRWKDDFAFNALGTTDELSSWLGVCREKSVTSGLDDVAEVLTRVQCILQDVGAHVATPPNSSERKKEKTQFDASFVQYVHELVDTFGDKVPPIRQFILPGGGELGAQLQYARAVCRRAERSLVPLLRDEVIDENALKFLNRYACLKTDSAELTYLPPLKSVQKELKWKSSKLEQKPLVPGN